jgi:hypothetical protein
MVKFISLEGSFFVPAAVKASAATCFAAKSETLIFLGSAEGECPWEFSAAVFHFSKKGSFFVFFELSAQPKNSDNMKTLNNDLSTILLIIEHFKAITLQC